MVTPMKKMMAYMGVDVQLQSFLTPDLGGDERSASHSGCFNPGDCVPYTQRAGRWVCFKDGRDILGKRKSLARARNRATVPPTVLSWGVKWGRSHKEKWVSTSITSCTNFLMTARHCPVSVLKISSLFSSILLQKPDSFSDSQENPCFLWNPKIHYHVCKGHPLDPTSSKPHIF
jgi:hypothetical protein